MEGARPKGGRLGDGRATGRVRETRIPYGSAVLGYDISHLLFYRAKEAAMQPGNRDDIPRRPLNLASGRPGAAPGERRPVPLGVNERIRAPRPTSGSPRPASPGRPAPQSARPAATRSGVSTARLAGTGSRGASLQPRGQRPQGARRGPAPHGGRAPHPPTRHPNFRQGAPARRRAGAYYLHGAPRRREGILGALGDPRLLVGIVAIVVIGFGAFTANAAIQHRQERIAAEQEAQRQQELKRQTVKAGKLGPTALPISTPRAEWERGTMPYLFQQDPLWSSAAYAGGTIAKNGCGPTSLAMVYIYLTGDTDHDPLSLAAFAEDNGFVSEGGTEWSLMDGGAQKLGLQVESLPIERGAIERALGEGRPIICNVGSGDFTAVGHYLVLSGVDERGMVSIHDPNSPENCARKWPIHQLLPQIKNPWAYSV